MTSTWYPQPSTELEAAPRFDPVGLFAGLVQRAIGGSAAALGVGQAAAAVASGERDPNRLTDVVFYARHPEHRGRPIGQSETQLRREWTWIRDQAIVPALRQLPAQAVAPVPLAPPPVAAPASPFTLPPDPNDLLPPARTHINTRVLFPGDVTLAAEAKLIEEIASRPDGWVYVTNWYAGLVFEGILMPQPSLMPFTNALWQCARKGGTIRALFWDGSLRELQAKIKEITAPLRQAGSVALTLVSPLASLAGAGSAVESAVEALIQHSITNRTNNRVNTATMTLINQMPHAAARLDDATLPVGSHHQKMLVVGNNERTVAVVGSVDLNKNRVMQLGGGTPYFDMSVQLDGQAAVDVAEIFERRWRAADDREHRAIPLPPRRPPTVAPPAPGTSSATVQVGVNYGCGHPHREIRRPVRSGGRLIANLLNNCRSFFYAEDQYGTGNDDLKRGIEQAFRNGARYGVVVLATSAGVDDIPEIEYWRHRFWSAFRQTGNNLFVFERVGDDSNPAFNDPVGPHAYVHSKLLIVDDRAASISSVNMNRRSWYYDSELAAVVTDAPDLIRKLRIDVWNTHLRDPFRLPAPDIRDPMAAADVWRAAYAHQRGLLKPIYFTRTPLRASQKTPIWATVGASLAGFDLSLIDLVMDGAHKELYDPEGPPRC